MFKLIIEKKMDDLDAVRSMNLIEMNSFYIKGAVVQ